MFPGTGSNTALGRNRRLLASTAGGIARGMVQRRAEFRYQFLREVWTAAKRFGAGDVLNIEVADIPQLWSAVVLGYIDDPQRSLIAALAADQGAKTFFEIGTSLGRTTWTVAHHNPGLRIWTLDMALDEDAEATALPIGEDDRSYFRPVYACGEAFRDMPEEASITQLWGDSARFDYSPYRGQMDLVYIDGAHSAEYVASDTRAALEILSPRGTIVWDDYATSPGVYEYLAAEARHFDRPIHHVVGTRMAIYSRTEFVSRRDRQYPFSG